MKVRPQLRFRLLAGGALLAAMVACAADPLNPQPLPPINDDNNAAGGFSDAGAYVPVGNDGGAQNSAGDAGGTRTDDASPEPPGDTDAAADAGPDADAGDADAAETGPN